MNKIKKFFLGIWTWISKMNKAFELAGISILKMLLTVTLIWFLIQGCSFHYYSTSMNSDGTGKPTIIDINLRFNGNEDGK